MGKTEILILLALGIAMIAAVVLNLPDPVEQVQTIMQTPEYQAELARRAAL